MNRKEQCPSCCIHTIAITSDNCDYINEIKRQYRLKGKSITVSRIVNKILAEHKFAKDTEATFTHKQYVACNKKECQSRTEFGFPNEICKGCDEFKRL